MRSAMVSRSSCEKTEAMYIMARPMGVDVSNCSRMETNATFSCASRSMRAVKSPILRLIRSSR